MAGSWRHMTTKSGKLRNPETFQQMIGNLGDAYEAAEECYGMIQWLADQLAVLTSAIPGTPGLPPVTRASMIATAETHYKDGAPPRWGAARQVMRSKRSGYRNGIWIDHMILICRDCLVPLVPARGQFGRGYEYCPECGTAVFCACDDCETLRVLKDLW